ncbi:uncharacterized protein K444DRAFT_699233 [Hyaloscypha bicolor E]|uniref:Dihydrofolate reductase n=1 Tax=Hyaloscypha bicolor E TaxID=1095630 RepID=A0A2J6SUJ5_9HELO|nr:uncharacterized protein K444DRAFT_699233 [Hyaloscypha bicolor E]PMD54436.1 hypothetical protein K444DRAFT_699233 [Hyaloscypha bicolor E]
MGRGSTLPRTGLRKEMPYFARVTKHASPGSTNAVIMGRKTWERAYLHIPAIEG